MTLNKRTQWRTHEYPATIVKDRYGGAYSGGSWVALPQDIRDIDRRIAGSDRECAEYWGEMDPQDYGIGDSPEEALRDLKEKMANAD